MNNYTLISHGILIGIGATILIDLWAIVLKKIFNVSSLNFCLLGRWLAWMPDGKFIHAQIANAGKKTAECTLGWTAHYLVGIIFGLTLVYLIPQWLAKPDLLPALIFGAVTVVLPYFIMQPALGLGIAASKTAKPLSTRFKSLTTHLLFGCGLYLSAITLKYLAST